MYSLTPRIALAVLALLVSLSILFFGAKFPLGQGLVPVLCAPLAICAVWLRSPLYSNRQYKMLIWSVFTPAAVFIIWGALQVLPVASSWANPFWGLVTQSGASHYLSLAPGLTQQHTVYALGLFLLAYGSYRLGAGPQPFAALKVVAISITLACVYGIIQYAWGNDYVLWVPKDSYYKVLSGTFINRNTFATLAGLGILANFGLMLQRVGEISSRLSTRQRFKAFWWLVLRPGWGWMFLALICFIALLLTGSRAGITASLCAILVMFGSLAGMREAVRLPLIGITVAFISFTVLMLALVGADLGARLLNVSGDALLRQEINIGSQQLISQFWLTGTGLGSYMQAFYTVHTAEALSKLYANIDHAHNTYYELVVEMGIPAAIMAAISLIALATALMVGLSVRRRAIMWPALGVATLVLVGGHALADFSLSVPAFAIAAIVVLMLALAQSLPTTDATEPAKPTCISYLIIVPAVMVMGLAGWQSVANYHAFNAAPVMRSLIAAKPVGPGPMFVTQRHLMRCLAVNPWHPTCRQDLAQVQLSLATGYGVIGPRADVGMVYLAMARDSYLLAIQQSPVNPLAWYRLARIEAFLGNLDAAEGYLANSVITGPAEPFLAMQRIPLMLQLLPQASPDNITLFSANLLQHWAASPRRVADELRANPTTQPAFASVLPDTEAEKANWKRFIRSPFPSAAPLGETSENR
ncbi:MAG: O-antigen ligase family protein [Alphaproteobacteria bacterium]|nr:MAG: O-antigen ligase family protein [Alphaproteobacteria bacterium]